MNNVVIYEFLIFFKWWNCMVCFIKVNLIKCENSLINEDVDIYE